ncbi:MAG: hypothetical protein ACTSRI_09970 [Promethearchaeota archaeon]
MGKRSRKNRNAYHNLNHRIRYRLSYSPKNNRRNFYYRQHDPLLNIGHVNSAGLIGLTNLEKKSDVNLRIEEIKSKIEEEIGSRRISIRKYISKDNNCFIHGEKHDYQLKKDFLNYLLEKSKFKFLKKRIFKKKLKNVRFNLEEGVEDILISQKRRHIFGIDQLKSVLGSEASEWEKWEDIIRIIGKNIEEFKLSFKKKELKELNTELERITFRGNKENMKICEKCGSENLRNAIYCHNCGSEFQDSNLF